MATGKQTAAAKRNIKKAASVAKSRKAISKMPTATPTALGQQSSGGGPLLQIELCEEAVAGHSREARVAANPCSHRPSRRPLVETMSLWLVCMITSGRCRSR
jgi:hypothetical protein